MKYGLLLAILSCSLLTFFGPSQQKKVNPAGDQVIYTWKSKSIGYSDLQHLYQSDSNASKTSFFNRKSLQSLHIDIDCRIKKTVLSRDNKGELACFQITGPSVKMEQQGQIVNLDLIEKELTHPILVEISREGSIKMTRVDTAISNLSDNILKGILSRLQFVRPAGNKNDWQVAEENSSGVYLAKYRQIKNGKNGLEFEKKNGGYTRLKYSGQNQRILDNGKTTISIDTTGAILGIRATDAQVVLFNTDTVTLSTNVVSINLESARKASGEELAPLLGLTHSANYNYRSALSAPLPEDKINRMAYSKTLGNDNLASLMTVIGLGDEKEEENLIMKFRALVYLFPASCEQLKEVLKKEPVGSYTFRVLKSALANAETETALNAIADIIDIRSHEEETVIELLPVLATCKAPTEKAVRIAKELAFSSGSTPDIASTAQLALGGLAYHFRKSNEKKSVEITAFLLEKMRAEKDTLQKIMVLANTGSATVLPVLKTYLEQPGISEEVKATAVSGFRLMEDSLSVNYLAKMVNSNDTVVVKKAKEVIAFQKEQL